MTNEAPPGYPNRIFEIAENASDPISSMLRQLDQRLYLTPRLPATFDQFGAQVQCHAIRLAWAVFLDDMDEVANEMIAEAQKLDDANRDFKPAKREFPRGVANGLRQAAYMLHAKVHERAPPR